MIQKDCRLAAIMYTDIVGFSKMMGADEAGTLRILDIHNAIVEEAVAQNQGTVIKTIGDAYMVDFRNTQQALQAAMTVQQKLSEYNEAHRNSPLLIRIGIHLGDIYFYENDAFGDGINIAARLQSYCRPGCICFSRDVYNQVLNKVEFHAEDLGVVPLKNIAKEINAYEIVTANTEFDPNFTQRRPATNSDEQKTSQTGNRSSAYARQDEPMSELDKTIQNLVSFVERKVNGIIDTSDSASGIQRDRYRDSSRSRERSHAHFCGITLGTNLENIGQLLNQEINDSIRDEVEVSCNNRRPSRRHRMSDEELFNHYVKRTERSANSAIPGFIGHLIPFLCVNVVLHKFFPVVGFPWQTVVTLGWGIGLASHAAGMINTLRLWPAVKKLPQLGRNALKAFKHWQNGKSSMLQQVVTSISVSSLLLFINYATSSIIRNHTQMSHPQFPWALIPSGILLLTMVTELFAFPFKNARKKRAFIDELSLPPAQNATEEKDTTETPSSLPAYAESLRIKADIESQLEKIGAEKPEYITLINETLATDGQSPAEFLGIYTQQIKTIEEDIMKIDGVLRTVPLHSIFKERADLEARRAEVEDPEVAQEYDRAIEELDRQRQSFKDLANHKQVLSVRLKTAVSSMTKLKLDIARIAAGSSEKENVVKMLESRANDLRLYADDLTAGYKEADNALR